jgi:hypothetical protein
MIFYLFNYMYVYLFVRRMIQGQLLAGYKAELQVMTIESLITKIIEPVLAT